VGDARNQSRMRTFRMKIVINHIRGNHMWEREQWLIDGSPQSLNRPLEIFACHPLYRNPPWLLSDRELSPVWEYATFSINEMTRDQISNAREEALRCFSWCWLVPGSNLIMSWLWPLHVTRTSNSKRVIRRWGSRVLVQKEITEIKERILHEESWYATQPKL